jgi:hypothetical protein
VSRLSSPHTVWRIGAIRQIAWPFRRGHSLIRLSSFEILPVHSRQEAAMAAGSLEQFEKFGETLVPIMKKLGLTQDILKS